MKLPESKADVMDQLPEVVVRAITSAYTSSSESYPM